MYENIEELKNHFPFLKLPKRGEIKWFAEKTGYSRTQVGDIFAGRRTYTDRFRRMALDAVQNRLFELGKLPPGFEAIVNPEEMKRRMRRFDNNDLIPADTGVAEELVSSEITDAKAVYDYLTEKFGPEMGAMIAQNRDTIMKMTEALTFKETQNVIACIAKILSERHNILP